MCDVLCDTAVMNPLHLTAISLSAVHSLSRIVSNQTDYRITDISTFQSTYSTSRVACTASIFSDQFAYHGRQYVKRIGMTFTQHSKTEYLFYISRHILSYSILVSHPRLFISVILFPLPIPFSPLSIPLHFKSSCINCNSSYFTLIIIIFSTFPFLLPTFFSLLLSFHHILFYFRPFSYQFIFLHSINPDS